MNSSTRPVSFVSSRNSPQQNSLQVLLPLFKWLLVVALVAMVGFAMQSPMGFRVVASLSLLILLLVLIKKFPQVGIVGTFLFLVMVGGIRRWVIPDFGWAAYDILIVIGPLVALFIFVSLILTKKVPKDTPLSRYIKILLLVMMLQVINPLQGGLLVGVGGILFYVIPLLWFYLGRMYGNPKNTLRLFQLATLIYIFTGLYGMKQTSIGLSASEKQWVKLSGFDLKISDQTSRAFSTFASPQEYSTTLACAICICMAFLIHRRILYALPLLILAPALLYTGTRGPVVAALFAICIQFSVTGRGRASWLPRLGLSLLLGIVGLTWSLKGVGTQGMNQAQRELLTHQQEGLLDPGKSTGPEHIATMFAGIFQGVKQPLGHGLGATTNASGKLGGGDSSTIIYSSEVDLSNMFISLGIVGGVIYAVIIFCVIKQAVVLWNQSRQLVFLVLLGYLLCTSGQWLNGGLYSLCFLTWFSIGMMDKAFLERNLSLPLAVAQKGPPRTAPGRRLPSREWPQRRGPLHPTGPLQPLPAPASSAAPAPRPKFEL